MDAGFFNPLLDALRPRLARVLRTLRRNRTLRKRRSPEPALNTVPTRKENT
ncbi:MAG TPA: hypothetical protein VFL61_05855 [Gaiellaceae bacterium]|nr:hypothetical protein [Gaiellaceae bacterium]